MRLLVSIIDRLAVKIEVSRHHCLGRTVGDGVPVDIDSGQFQRRRYLVGHRFHVVGWDEAPTAR
jgi:hypothetical protein